MEIQSCCHIYGFSLGYDGKVDLGKDDNLSNNIDGACDLDCSLINVDSRFVELVNESTVKLLFSFQSEGTLFLSSFC